MRVTWLAILSVLAVVLTACSSSSGGSPVPTTEANTSPDTPPNTPTNAPLASAASYVSVGDSYAAGYQPTAEHEGSTTRNGFAYQVPALAKAKGYDLTLVNFGCSGATTDSVLHAPGCRPDYLGPGAPRYTEPQADAAERYLRAHRGHVDLITVSLGGNDLTSCVAEANPVGCINTALSSVQANLHTLLTGLRAAAGPATRIVGITYPDVFLGDALSADPSVKNLANLSVVGFKSLINPALEAQYRAAGASFVDVTAATGAYGSMSQTTTLSPYGTIPFPVAKVCELTYYCQYRDIHPRTAGYRLIAGLVVGALPPR